MRFDTSSHLKKGMSRPLTIQRERKTRLFFKQALVMAKDKVVVYFGKLGGRLQEHQRLMLMKDAETIAHLLCCDFAGEYCSERSLDGPTFYVPDDSLLTDEASLLGIQSPQ